MSVDFERLAAAMWSKEYDWAEKIARLDGMWDLLCFTTVKPTQNDERIALMDDIVTLITLAEERRLMEYREARCIARNVGANIGIAL